MKSSGRLRGGTLLEECVEQYCHYLLRFLLHYKHRGFAVAAITLQNEPYHGDADYPCMSLEPERQAAVARALVPLLRSNGLDTLVLGHDHNYSDLEGAVELLARAGDVLDGTAWHAYEGKPSAL